MKLYIDSCDISNIVKLNDILEIDGITTNPSIITASGKDPEVAISELCGILRPEQKLFVQTIRTDYGGIMSEARRISALRQCNAYVKIPVTAEGLKAIRTCRKEGIGTLATAIFSSSQGMMAALNGADFLAPYVNRMCNYVDGIAEVTDLMHMLRKAGSTSEIIAASFKNVNQIHALMKAGIDAVTVPCDLIFKMMGHPGTDDAVNGFTKAWTSTYGRTSLFKG